MPDTFNFMHDRGASRKSKPNTVSVKFGDGYSQRYQVGINNLEEQWDLSFRNREVTEANNIISFLQNKNGTEFFYWTPPGESTQFKIICQEWNLEYGSEFSRSITCTFMRVYDITPT